MQRKLTFAVDDAVYQGLARIAGRRRISRFIEDLVRPHVLGERLEDGYRAMAADLDREREASACINGLAGDMARKSR